MKTGHVRAVLFVLCLIGTGAALAREPVIGGPCDGCEHVFVGQPEAPGSQSRIAPATAPGEAMVIEGTVRHGNGTLAEGIVVYAYHTNADGIYPKAKTPHGAFRGWARTGADGTFRFDTIRPGAYPGSAIPQHVHMHVIEPGTGTYYIDDIVFADDPLLTSAQRTHAGSGRGGPGLCHPHRNEEGVWRIRRDIVLGENIPNHPDAGD